MIPQDTIAKILDAARIEEVVGEFVSLKRRGSNLIGLCPFHNEKTPSFTVSAAKGFYKCFGCGAGGNSVKFLMDHEHYNFTEALKYLAKKYQIEVEERESTPEELKAAGEKESLHSVTAMAADFYENQLWETSEGRTVGLSYFEERGFLPNTLKKFKLGYAPDQKDTFFNYAISKGYQSEYLEKAGLIIAHGDSFADRFRARVMFPIHNLSGRVIGFGGRILTRDKSVAKYINTPETDIYHKSQILYGIYAARKPLSDLNNCYLVEGYTDVISLYQAGITNVVASSGTSLTTEQIRLIRRYTPNITILYDGDAAGIKASFRGIDMVLKEGLNVKIVLFPDGEDPDSFARSHRSEEVSEFITQNARHFIGFKTQLLLDETQGDPVKRAGLIKEILGSIALIPDSIIRAEYVKYCSETLQIAEQTLIFELNKLLAKNRGKTETVPEAEVIVPDKPEIPQQEYSVKDISFQENNIIRLLLNFGHQEFKFPVTHENGDIQEVEVNTAHFVVNELMEDEYTFENPVYQKIFQEYKEAFENNLTPAEQYFIHHPDEEISETAIRLLTSPYTLSPNWYTRKGIYTPTETEKLKDNVILSVYNLRLKRIELLMSETQKELESAEADDAMILLKRMADLNIIKSRIASILGRILLN